MSPQAVICFRCQICDQTHEFLILVSNLKGQSYEKSTVCVLSYKLLLKTCTLGWSDLVFFAIFEKRQVSAVQVYFYEFNSKKSGNRVLVALAAKFVLSKNHRDLKNYYVF